MFLVVFPFGRSAACLHVRYDIHVTTTLLFWIFHQTPLWWDPGPGIQFTPGKFVSVVPTSAPHHQLSQPSQATSILLKRTKGKHKHAPAAGVTVTFLCVENGCLVVLMCGVEVKVHHPCSNSRTYKLTRGEL